MKFGMFTGFSTFAAGALTVFQASLAVAAPLLEGATEAITTTSPYFDNASNTTTPAPPPVSPATEGALIGVGIAVGIALIVAACKYCSCGVFDKACCEENDNAEEEGPLMRSAATTQRNSKHQQLAEKYSQKFPRNNRLQELASDTINYTDRGNADATPFKPGWA